MASTNKYWKGIDELQETKAFVDSRDNEFPEQNNLENLLAEDSLGEASSGRRDFLKFLGFSLAAATVASCESPVIKAIPYVMKPENVVPGVATWYASTYYDGSSYASILVKTREARPIFIKGNGDFGFTNGIANAQIIASVLGLYDSERLQGPEKKGKPASWSTVDKDIQKGLKTSKKTTLISNTVISPSIERSINALKESLDGEFEHIQYDPISYSAIRKANDLNFGSAFIPSYNFLNAKTIVSVNADFLNTWLMPTEFSCHYGQRRNPDGDWMSQHFHFEACMSVTGSNADYRGMTKPSEESSVLQYILDRLKGKSSSLPKALKSVADKSVTALKKSGKESLVVCGTNNVGLQQLTNEINALIGANGSTIDLYNEVNLFESQEAEMMRLIGDLKKGKGPDSLIFYNSNPVYSMPNGKEFEKLLKSVKMTVSMNAYGDETATSCKYLCPDHHALEAWADFRAKTNHYALAQPMITPIHNTASAMESFLVWSGNAVRGGKDSTVAYEVVKATYSELHDGDFDMAVHNSCVNLDHSTLEDVKTFSSVGLADLPVFEKGTELIAYQKTGIGDGKFSNNPWLQEMPDPISKVTWDNYITMNPVEMTKSGYATTYDQENGLSMATVKSNGEEFTLPVYPSPGQALGTVGVALGYGRGGNGEKIGKAAYQTKEYGGYITDEKGNPKPIGENVYRMISTDELALRYTNSAKITKVDGEYLIASTQIHHTVMGRHSIVR
jgi:molybdopterin-containing oxidoreductase family iron-sulfur binding subunit